MKIYPFRVTLDIPSSNSRYYTLHSLYHFLRHADVDHSAYARDAIGKNIVVVRKQDRESVYDYLTGRARSYGEKQKRSRSRSRERSRGRRSKSRERSRDAIQDILGKPPNPTLILFWVMRHA